MNIAIDGPAGAGKSTIAKAVARELNSIYVDTGAMYRAMALYMLKNDISPDDTESIEKACESADISIVYKDGAQHVILNGEDVTGELRTEAVGNMASSVSVNGKVRKKLVSLQQKLAHSTSVVMDGRDIGTVVLPDADLKIYLTASVETRADRRYKELIAKGQQPDLDEIRRDIADRDHRDMNRENSPLRQAEDAVLIDSSDMTIPEVVDRILGLTEGLHK
ncbi:MAG TPA: (d)CMP kinase [Lachnospiraceae bacterium]|nr:(d)CMP kinase [Lachnospiraceae bacterium]